MGEEIRAYANEQLNKISQATLTDEEALFLPEVYDKALIFEALARVLNSRGATGNGFKKLQALATIENTTVGIKQNKRSDILVGMVVE